MVVVVNCFSGVLVVFSTYNSFDYYFKYLCTNWGKAVLNVKEILRKQFLAVKQAKFFS